MRLPTFADLRRFAEVEGWEDWDKAAGRHTGDHHRYFLTTPRGDRLMTRISHGIGQLGDRDLFAHVLRDQLQVTEEQFWAAVDRGVRPRRPQPSVASEDDPSLDAKLVHLLLTKVGLAPADLVGMSPERAVEIWNTWLAASRRVPDEPG